jgi:hypothetical protein
LPKRVRSESDGSDRKRALAGGGGEGTTAAGDERRRSAMNGGEVRRRRTLTRVLVHGLGRGRHLRVAREATKRPGAAAVVETRRRGRTTRRHGSGIPARSLGRHGARARQQTARACSSPPGAAPERLPDDEAAAQAGIRRRRQKLGFWLRRHTTCRGGGSAGGVQGAAGGLNSPERSLGVRATHRRRTRWWRGTRPSPGRTRRGGRDDGWDPTVSDSGAARAEGKRAGEAWAGRPTGPGGCCAAALRGWRWPLGRRWAAAAD